MDVESAIRRTIRDIPDFPKPGIMFKDLTPILKDPDLCRNIADKFSEEIARLKPDALVCLDSRGFWFGLMVAAKLNIPMIPVRKEGKLPYKTHSQEYELEYGTAKIEIHTDALKPGWKVVIHDDLLATGGTASAAASLVETQGASIAGFAFLVELSFLGGEKKISPFSDQIISLAKY